jgi:hypothetical protein
MYVRTGMYSLHNVIHNCLVLIQSTHIKRKICKNKYVNLFSNKATAK